MFNNPYGYYGMANNMANGMRAVNGLGGAAASRGGLGGLLGNLFGRGASTGAAATGAIRQGVNWGGLLTNAQKTLGVVNQAIPIVQQVRPMLNNAKTMFKIADAVRGDVNTNNTNTSNSNNNNNVTTNNNLNNATINRPEVNQNIQDNNKPVFYL